MFSKHANVILKSQGTGLSRGVYFGEKTLAWSGGILERKICPGVF